LGPAELPGGHAKHLPKMAREMTLVREASGERNLRQWQFRASQHLLRPFDAPLHEIVMRGYTG
jgi:hypothetical protein